METGTAPVGASAEVRPSLTDTLSAAFDEAKVDAPDAPVAEPAAAPAEAVKADAPKVDATGRVHGTDGKFTAKAEEKPASAASGTASATSATSATSAIQRPKRPDSWAKEYWDDWEKIDPRVADYLAKREGQYLQGVTTYKQEWEKLKPISDALQPYQQFVQATGGAPQFIKALADTHATLSGQDPQAKLRAFARFAKDYQIPLEQLLVQGEDGKVYLNNDYFQPEKQAAQPALTQQDIDNRVSQALAKERIQQAVASFVSEKDETGAPKYPHATKVLASMDGLLRSRLADDLPSAYAAALALPKHSDLAAADRQQREDAAKAAETKAKQDAADRARANIVSPKNQAPTALVSAAANGKKGLRDVLSASLDAATGGRV